MEERVRELERQAAQVAARERAHLAAPGSDSDGSDSDGSDSDGSDSDRNGEQGPMPEPIGVQPTYSNEDSTG
jgi:hypothetical protein